MILSNRIDGRKADELRPVKFTRGYTKHAAGSVLVEMGETKVICTATIEDKVPPFMRNTGKGWLTAEYSMLPSSTHTRKVRDASRGKVDGRTQEIQRLIGRALRAVVDLDNIGEKTIWIDCDVIQADGGTRTASITGSFIALVDAINSIKENDGLKHFPIRNYVAAVSVGIVNNRPVLDLNYDEDSNAKVDMNIVMTDYEEFIEVQGTGEEAPFTKTDLMELLRLAEKGNKELIELQKKALGELADQVGKTLNEMVDEDNEQTNCSHCN